MGGTFNPQVLFYTLKIVISMQKVKHFVNLPKAAANFSAFWQKIFTIRFLHRSKRNFPAHIDYTLT